MDFNRQTDFETFSLQTSSPLSFHKLRALELFTTIPTFMIFALLKKKSVQVCIAQQFYHMLDKVLEMFLDLISTGNIKTLQP